jgi:photosystem II stability/assembly factor-like uncharacterized protein
MYKSLLRILISLVVFTGITGATLPPDPVPDTPAGTLSGVSPTVYKLNLPLLFRAPLPDWVGPFGGNVVVIAPDPNNANIVYAGTWGAGVLKSTDGGLSWLPSRGGLWNLRINSLTVDPTNSAVLYAGTYGDGVFKSTNAGLTWAQSNSGVQAGAIVYTIAVDPETPSRVYIGTRGDNITGANPWKGILYKSDNGGASWRAVLENVGGTDQQDWIYSIAVLPRDPNLILAASHEHGPYRSTNYGDTWAAASNGISDGSGRSVVFNPLLRLPSTAYFAVWHRTGLFKTTNDANAWSLNTNGINNTKVYGLAIDRNDPAHLYAATFIASAGDPGGVLHSADSGQSWKQAGLQGLSIYSVAVNPADGNILYTGTVGAGAYRSADRGASWQANNTGLSVFSVSTLLVAPGSSDTLYAATNGVQRSVDKGLTWVPLGYGLPYSTVNALLFHPSNPNLLYALTDSAGLYRIDITSGGWARLASITSGSTLQNASGVLYPTGPLAQPDPLREIDPDESLAAQPQNEMQTLPNAPLLAMAFAPSSNPIQYIGTSGSGVYRTWDNGENWYAAGLAGQTVWSLAVDPANYNKVYAATAAPGTVKLTTDGGLTWTDTTLPGLTPYALAYSPIDPTVLYVGTSSGLYQSTAGGSWTPAGLSGKMVTAITPHPTRAGLLFAGTSAGAYISTDGGVTWAAGPAGLAEMGIKSITINPNDKITVYFATNGSGAYHLEYR